MITNFKYSEVNLDTVGLYVEEGILLKKTKITYHKNLFNNINNLMLKTYVQFYLQLLISSNIVQYFMKLKYCTRVIV